LALSFKNSEYEQGECHPDNRLGQTRQKQSLTFAFDAPVRFKRARAFSSAALDRFPKAFEL
jgi:hypothetical protein